MPTDRTCPVCGEPYDYRIPTRHAEKFSAADEHRHRPRQGEYVYVHKIYNLSGLPVAEEYRGGDR
jgi:rRNA maturation protein Nop10